MNLFSALGIVGNLCFGFACISFVVRTAREGHARGMPWITTLLFLLANSSFSAFLFGTYGFDVLFSIGIVETISWGIVVGYKVHDEIVKHPLSML